MAAKGDASKPTVGVVGLGIMGLAYARNLRDMDFEVVGYDVAADRLAELERFGGQPAKSPAEVAKKADRILTALPSVEALREAVTGKDGIASTIAKSAIVAEMSTLPLEAKEEMRKALEAKGATLLDSPVSGTGAQAAVRDLVVFVSGNEQQGEKMRPVFEALARDVRHVGAFGAGMKLKFIANLLVTIHNLAAAEALLLGQKAGLDLDLVFDAIKSGAGTSRMFEVRGPLMIHGRYEPATMKFDVYQKDIKLILDFARAMNCPTPLMDASVPYYDKALAEGRDKQDTAGLFAVLEGIGKRK